MKTKLLSLSWVNTELSEELKEAVEIISQDVWKGASVRFSAKGWDGDSGYFFKNKTWIRVTFRHQMSLGADILDAIKICKIEGMEIAAILAANRSTLTIVSPNDAFALVSFEKLQSEVLSLNGAIDIPLLIGELTPLTSASTAINAELKKERPRDVSVPKRV